MNMLTRTQWIEQFKADLRDYRNAVCDFMMWGNSEEAVAATHSKVVCRVLTLANRVADWPTLSEVQTGNLLADIDAQPAQPARSLAAAVVDAVPFESAAGDTYINEAAVMDEGGTPLAILGPGGEFTREVR
jgi:hypothetical protein